MDKVNKLSDYEKVLSAIPFRNSKENFILFTIYTARSWELLYGVSENLISPFVVL
jgi:hypothetical protein